MVDDHLFTYVSRELAEIQSDANRLTSNSKWRKRKDSADLNAWIQRNCESVRRLLVETLSEEADG